MTTSTKKKQKNSSILFIKVKGITVKIKTLFGALLIVFTFAGCGGYQGKTVGEVVTFYPKGVERAGMQQVKVKHLSGGTYNITLMCVKDKNLTAAIEKSIKEGKEQVLTIQYRNTSGSCMSGTLTAIE